MKVNTLSRVRPLVTPWTAAYQAPPSMGFSKQECWGGMPLPSPARDMESVLILIKGALLSFQACVRTFHETPLQLLEKIKNVFNETKNLLKKDWNIFSKNCNNSFAKCSSHGKHGRGQQVWGWGRVSGTEVHWVGGGGASGWRDPWESAWLLLVCSCVCRRACFVYICGFVYL